MEFEELSTDKMLERWLKDVDQTYIDIYDSSWRFRDEEREWLKKKFRDISKELKRPLRVLDIGCATGFFANYIAKKLPKELTNESLIEFVKGVDFSKPQIKEAKKRYQKKGYLEFEVEDAFNLPQKEGGFDVVMLLDVLPNLGRNLQDENGELPYQTRRVISKILVNRNTNKAINTTLVNRKTDDASRKELVTLMGKLFSFDHEARRRFIKRVHHMLIKPGGYLILSTYAGKLQRMFGEYHYYVPRTLDYYPLDGPLDFCRYHTYFPKDHPQEHVHYRWWLKKKKGHGYTESYGFSYWPTEGEMNHEIGDYWASKEESGPMHTGRDADLKAQLNAKDKVRTIELLRQAGLDPNTVTEVKTGRCYLLRKKG